MEDRGPQKVKIKTTGYIAGMTGVPNGYQTVLGCTELPFLNI